MDGAEFLIGALRSDTEVTVHMMDQLFRPEVLEDLIYAITDAPLQVCVSWWLSHLQCKKQKAGRFLAKVALRGMAALTDTPRLVWDGAKRKRW